MIPRIPLLNKADRPGTPTTHERRTARRPRRKFPPPPRGSCRTKTYSGRTKPVKAKSSLPQTTTRPPTSITHEKRRQDGPRKNPPPEVVVALKPTRGGPSPSKPSLPYHRPQHAPRQATHMREDGKTAQARTPRGSCRTKTYSGRTKSVKIKSSPTGQASQRSKRPPTGQASQRSTRPPGPDDQTVHKYLTTPPVPSS
jgi:hypothetical protein